MPSIRPCGELPLSPVCRPSVCRLPFLSACSLGAELPVSLTLTKPTQEKPPPKQKPNKPKKNTSRKLTPSYGGSKAGGRKRRRPMAKMLFPSSGRHGFLSVPRPADLAHTPTHSCTRSEAK